LGNPKEKQKIEENQCLSHLRSVERKINREIKGRNGYSEIKPSLDRKKQVK